MSDDEVRIVTVIDDPLVPLSEDPDAFEFADDVACTVCDQPIGEGHEAGMVQGDMFWMPICSEACTEDFYADDADGDDDA